MFSTFPPIPQPQNPPQHHNQLPYRWRQPSNIFIFAKYVRRLCVYRDILDVTCEGGTFTQVDYSEGLWCSTWCWPKMLKVQLYVRNEHIYSNSSLTFAPKLTSDRPCKAKTFPNWKFSACVPRTAIGAHGIQAGDLFVQINCVVCSSVQNCWDEMHSGHDQMAQARVHDPFQKNS